MSTLFKTSANVFSIALAYYDEVEEVLKEIDETNLYFSLHPYKTEYKRLYLIGDMIYSEIIKVSITAPSGYDVKVKKLDTFDSLSNFDDATNEVYCTVSNSYLNAIPLDILITSLGITYDTQMLEINIKAGGD